MAMCHHKDPATENSECSNTTDALGKHLKINIMGRGQGKKGGVKMCSSIKTVKKKETKKKLLK